MAPRIGLRTGQHSSKKSAAEVNNAKRRLFDESSSGNGETEPTSRGNPQSDAGAFFQYTAHSKATFEQQRNDRVSLVGILTFTFCLLFILLTFGRCMFTDMLQTCVSSSIQFSI